MRYLLVLLVATCLFRDSSSSPLIAQDAASAYKTNPKFISAMAEAKKLEQDRQYIFATDSYKKANKIAGGKDEGCLESLTELQIKIGDYKAAAITAAAAEEIAATPRDKSAAEMSRGVALYRQAGDKGKPDLLHAADDAFKAAQANDAKNASAHYMDGYVLTRLGQMDAAREQFQACVSCLSPKDPSYTRVQHFAADPALSMAKRAPSFTVISLDGSKFTLDEMGGRVVLIDFWATWCGPCNEELPHMKKIAKEFAGQPLVIISVSWDSDETKWKSFIAKNEMNWVQYRDADHGLSKSFGVQAIPHYFTIDSDGVLTAEMLGSGSDVEGKLKKLVAKAKASGATAPPVAGGN
ncbi:TlpA disulfide reductase family protein [Granulicella arctica]|uniref:Thiol-disulfide isomerase/thioredoxin n=1 Tax=Granulicella arctica TaxID=940613 RepID=A0A7Y9TG46_9BACT|nr:TlpA disulfide reductase family protein [Granulicella arctica]NYF79089.1 thiol-disulfide isomerase/thioredoxin [Granulicella arctica]